MMQRLSIISLLALIFSMLVLSAELQTDSPRPETYFRFQIQSRDELHEITRIISIDNVIGDTVYAYANSREFERFEALGKTVEILSPPSMKYKPKMSDSVKKVKTGTVIRPMKPIEV